jgi:hypothetical protein
MAGRSRRCLEAFHASWDVVDLAGCYVDITPPKLSGSGGVFFAGLMWFDDAGMRVMIGGHKLISYTS